MNYFIFSINPQVADTSKSSSFLEQNRSYSAQKTSILSSDYQSKSIDSLVQLVTKKRRIYPRKKKSIKIYSTYLKVKKDSCFVLKELQTKPFSLHQLPSFEKVNKQKKQKILKPKGKIKEVHLQKNKKETFKTHALIEEKNIQNHNFSTDYGIAIILLFSVFLMGYIRFRFREKLKYYYKSFFNFSFFKKMITERNVLVRAFSTLLSIVMLINFSLVVLYTIYTYANPSIYYLLLFLYVFLAFIAIFLFYDCCIAL